MIVEHLTQASYLAAAALFILSLRWLSAPKTARRGVAAGVGGMALAIAGTLLHPGIVNFTWIVAAVIVGTAIGVPLSRVPLTARTAADGAVACVRRPGGGPGGHGGVHDRARRRHADGVPDDRARRGGNPWLPDVHRQPDGRRQAAGGHPDTADHIPRPESGEPDAPRDRSGGRRHRHRLSRPVAALSRHRSTFV